MEDASDRYVALHSQSDGAASSVLARRLALVASGVSLVLFLAAAAFGPPSHHVALGPAVAASMQAGAAPRQALRADGLNASMATDLVEGQSRQCWTWTGGSCSWNWCDSWRKADCTASGWFHLCTCGSGCVGADSACHTQRNVRVAGGISLENVRFGGYYLRVPTTWGFTQLRVGTDLDDYAKFDLWEVPGTMSGQKRYVIGPTQLPDNTLEFATSSSIIGSPWKAIDGKPGSWGSAPADPAHNFWTVCKVNGHVRLGDFTGAIWAYIHHGSWLAYGWNVEVWRTPSDETEWILTDSSLLGQLDDCS